MVICANLAVQIEAYYGKHCHIFFPELPVFLFPLSLPLPL